MCLKTNNFLIFFPSAPMLASGKSLQMSFLLETTKVCQPPDEGIKSNSYKYLSGVFEAMGKLDGVGIAKIAELWKMSGLQLNQLLQPSEISEFISNTVSFFYYYYYYYYYSGPENLKKSRPKNS